MVAAREFPDSLKGIASDETLVISKYLPKYHIYCKNLSSVSD